MTSAACFFPYSAAYGIEPSTFLVWHANHAMMTKHCPYTGEPHGSPNAISPNDILPKLMFSWVISPKMKVYEVALNPHCAPQAGH
jgi:hypothetical protein